ncbi:MAG: hypothetical protein JO026_03720 [Patescibacteria group bacterium]|nr:hypothetical protein [Patescibacteria group bacterium]
MYRTGFILLILSGASWALVGNVSGDWHIAGYTLVAILVFGYMLLLNAFRIHGMSMRERDTAELSKALAKAQDKMRQYENLRLELRTTISKGLEEPLIRIHKSLALLLSGTYGTLPPAAEESLRQVEESAALLRNVSQSLIDEAERPEQRESKSSASITKLKIT